MATEMGQARATFAHEALLYAGVDSFVDGCTAFIREGVAAREPVLVVVATHKIALLREALNGAADGVALRRHGRSRANRPGSSRPGRTSSTEPARRPSGARNRRTDLGRALGDELVECQRHEALLNVAFAYAAAAAALPVRHERAAGRGDRRGAAQPPDRRRGRRRLASDRYRGLEAVAAPFDAPLPDPPPTAIELRASTATARWTADTLVVRPRGADAGLSPCAANDLVLAVNEIATNSVRHGGGAGRAAHLAGRRHARLRDRGRRLDRRSARRPAQARSEPARPARALDGEPALRPRADPRAPPGNVVRLHMRRN